MPSIGPRAGRVALRVCWSCRLGLTGFGPPRPRYVTEQRRPASRKSVPLAELLDSSPNVEEDVNGLHTKIRAGKGRAARAPSLRARQRPSIPDRQYVRPEGRAVPSWTTRSTLAEQESPKEIHVKFPDDADALGRILYGPKIDWRRRSNHDRMQTRRELEVRAPASVADLALYTHMRLALSKCAGGRDLMRFVQGYLPIDQLRGEQTQESYRDRASLLNVHLLDLFLDRLFASSNLGNNVACLSFLLTRLEMAGLEQQPVNRTLLETLAIEAAHAHVTETVQLALKKLDALHGHRPRAAWMLQALANPHLGRDLLLAKDRSKAESKFSMGGSATSHALSKSQEPFLSMLLRHLHTGYMQGSAYTGRRQPGAIKVIMLDLMEPLQHKGSLLLDWKTLYPCMSLLAQCRAGKEIHGVWQMTAQLLPSEDSLALRSQLGLFTLYMLFRSGDANLAWQFVFENAQPLGWVGSDHAMHPAAWQWLIDHYHAGIDMPPDIKAAFTAPLLKHWADELEHIEKALNIRWSAKEGRHVAKGNFLHLADREPASNDERTSLVRPRVNADEFDWPANSSSGARGDASVRRDFAAFASLPRLLQQARQAAEEANE